VTAKNEGEKIFPHFMR